MARVYRHVSTPLIFLGLELMDLVIFLIGFLLMFNISNHLFLNLLFLAGFYVSLRWMKQGKAPGYVQDVLRFLSRPAEQHVRLENTLPALFDLETDPS